MCFTEQRRILVSDLYAGAGGGGRKTPLLRTKLHVDNILINWDMITSLNAQNTTCQSHATGATHFRKFFSGGNLSKLAKLAFCSLAIRR